MPLCPRAPAPALPLCACAVQRSVPSSLGPPRADRRPLRSLQEGKKAFWHSSAHILGHSMELVYGGWLTIGPPVEDGFYYDMYTGPEACGKARSASEDDFAGLEKK